MATLTTHFLNIATGTPAAECHRVAGLAHERQRPERGRRTTVTVRCPAPLLEARRFGGPDGYSLTFFHVCRVLPLARGGLAEAAVSR